METYTEPFEMVDNPHYEAQRRKSLQTLDDAAIDAPIIGIINGFNRLPFCFTLQSCYGHFLYKGQKDPYNCDPLPVTTRIARVKYRIAYIFLCLENSLPGRKFFQELKKVTLIDPANVQFCSSSWWYWKRQLNSYALQVEPDRFKDKDTATLDYREALHIEKIRNEFFVRLNTLVGKRRG